MHLLSFLHAGRRSWGVSRPDGIADLGGAGSAFADLRAFLAAGAPADALENRRAPRLHPDEVTLLPVVPNPDKIVMVALNYTETDAPAPAPDYPVTFLRLAASQIAHMEPMVQPRCSQKLDFEGELAAIIGTGGRHIRRADALAHVAGYSIYNDGSVRDWQKHSHQFTPGKNFAGTGAFGPWMVPAAHLPPGGRDLSLVTRVNGVEKQRTSTERMIFDVAWLVSYISTFTPLLPGDVIVTGTCTGFGITRKPPEFLAPGDMVEVEIDGIGTLRNPVIAEGAGFATG